MDKVYLGDGVYAEVARGMIKLESGNETYNVIYLEPAVVEALVRYAERVKKTFTEQRQAAQKE